MRDCFLFPFQLIKNWYVGYGAVSYNTGIITYSVPVVVTCLSERCLILSAMSPCLLEKCLLCQISKGLCVGSCMDCRSYWPNIYREVALHHLCCISTWFGPKCLFTSKVLTKSQCGCESLPAYP